MKIKTDFKLIGLALISTKACALDLLFEPDFSLRERYDDNVRMQIHSKNSNLISTISPGVMLGYLSDDNELKARFKWNELLYSENSEFDFSEKLANLSHQFQNELFKTDLAASYSEESSINTQLDLTGSGDVQVLVPRKTKSISPTITYSLSAKNSLQLGYSFADVAFDRKPGLLTNVNYTDYTFQQFSATAIHAYSERLSFNLTGSYSDFKSGNETPGVIDLIPGFIVDIPVNNGFTQKSTTFTYQGGLQYLFDEQTQLALSAGIRDTTTNTSQFTKLLSNGRLLSDSKHSSNSVGHVFSASLTRKHDWGDWSFNASQQLNPASTGNQQTSTSLGIKGRYNFDDRWSAGLNANYLMTDSVSTFNNTNINNSRTYSTLSPNLTWRWTPEVNLDLSYSYRQQEFQSNNQTAIGNSVQLQFSYQPQINRQVK